MIRRSPSAWILAAAIMAAPALPVAAANHIGVAGAVQNTVTGTVGGASEALATGSRVYQDETVSTGAGSMAQLIFLDETSLSIGPKSEVRLDTFVYNPGAGTGSVVLDATKGAFRFITGSQKPTNYKLVTAIATIGVRGTIVDCYLTEKGLICIGQEGKVILTVNGVEYALLPGQLLFVGADKKVTGPMAPDGQFFDVVGIAPFELFGAHLPGEHVRFDVPDDSTARLDEIFDHPDCDCR